MFDEQDRAYFDRQRKQADLAAQALAAGEVQPGASGEYVAFHQGKVVARGSDPMRLVRAADVPREDLFVMFVPGRDDVLVY